jgi:hypothetical protein
VPAPAITTVWDWLSQVNAANYAGHDDWRLPSESACNACYVDDPSYSCTACNEHELETILLSSAPCGVDPCIPAIFGATASSFYWSSATRSSCPEDVWGVNFGSGVVGYDSKAFSDDYVRAVRDGS